MSENLHLRKLAAILLLAILPSLLFASEWQVGVEAGYTAGFYDQKGGDRTGKEFSIGSAFEIAIPVEYRPLDWLGITTGARYIGKAYNTEKSENAYSIRTVEHFFEFPLGLRFSAGDERFRFYIGGGGYIGARFLTTEMGNFSLHTFINTSSHDGFWSVLELDPRYDAIFDAGVYAEAGYGVSAGRGEIMISLRYQYSLTELDRYYQGIRSLRRIDTLSITLGYSFFLGGAR